MLLSESAGGVRPAYAPHVSPSDRQALESHFVLRPVDSSSLPLAKLLDELAPGSIVVIGSRHPADFSVDKNAARHSIHAAMRGLGFSSVRWRGSGAHILIGVQGAAPGTAIEVWQPGLAQVDFGAGQPIGTTGIRAPVSIQVLASTGDTDIIIGGRNVSPHHRDYNLIVVEPESGSVRLTVHFDTDTFLVNNVRVYRIAAIRKGDSLVRVDPACWQPPDGKLDFSDPGTSWHLGEGWSGMEAWGTWALGRESTLQVSLTANTAYVMQTKVTPYCPTPDAHQSMTVFWNHTRLAELDMNDCAPQMLEVEVPAAMVSGGVDQITFRYAYAASPFESTGGISGDQRLLAVGFTAVQFEPQP